MVKRFSSLFTLLILFSCQGKKTQLQEETKEKPTHAEVVNHSYSKLDQVRTAHLNLDLLVDMDNKIIEGIARHRIKNQGFEKAYFDIKDIHIEKVTLGAPNNEVKTTFQIGKYDSLLGAPLIVDLREGDLFINIYYSTSPHAEALDWLDPELTGSGKYPFLYTQGQAILTRTWIPIQDTPENRFTYHAKVKVPEGILPLMSATNPTELNETGVYHFEMKQPIPSYLMALT